MADNADELHDILERAVTAAAKLLAERVAAGEASASEIAQLRAMFKDVGGAYAFNGKPTQTGDDIIESMRDIDPTMFN